MCLKDSGLTFTVEREREREGEVINKLHMSSKPVHARYPQSNCLIS